MKKIFLGGIIISLTSLSFVSCSDNKAAEVKHRIETQKKEHEKLAPARTDGPSIANIETEAYVFKLHRAFTYQPKGSEILQGFKPKPGYKFIYLDVSLKNKSTSNIEGGFLFIAMKLTDDKGIEYKKPAAALAAYTSEHPEDNNPKEYEALWDTFEPEEFHREILYAVEVPVNAHSFVLHMPTDRKRKEWKTLSFSL